MRNKDGDFQYTKTMNDTGEELVGIGKTKEEAKANLKKEVAKYRDLMAKGLFLVEAGKPVPSPAMVMKQDSKGNMVYEMDYTRTVRKLVRPSLKKIIDEQDGV